MTDDDDATNCTVCGEQVRYGSRHHTCGSAVMAAELAEREKWRDIAHRVAAAANMYGLEGLKVRCTISPTGAVTSWEINRA